MLLSPGRISDWLYEAGAVSIPVFVCSHLHVEALTVPTVLLLIPKYAMQIKQHTGSFCVCMCVCEDFIRLCSSQPSESEASRASDPQVLPAFIQRCLA